MVENGDAARRGSMAIKAISFYKRVIPFQLMNGR
jgi:hypothetical protein